MWMWMCSGIDIYKFLVLLLFCMDLRWLLFRTDLLLSCHFQRTLFLNRIKTLLELAAKYEDEKLLVVKMLESFVWFINTETLSKKMWCYVAPKCISRSFTMYNKQQQHAEVQIYRTSNVVISLKIDSNLLQHTY